LRAPPNGLEADALTEPLFARWNFEVSAAEYAPVGGGSYHWIVTDPAGERRFVTVDDLEGKPWLGDRAFDGLRAAFDTAVTLRSAGLDFVLAPIATSDGSSVIRIDPPYTLAAFPFVEGRAGDFGVYDASERTALVPMLAALHSATPTARRLDLALPGRGELDEALSELDRPWDAGPLGEPARELLTCHAAGIVELLTLYDRLTPGQEGWVVTHGEPHGANLIAMRDGHLLIDWDTVAVAPHERDLWMLVDDDPAAARRYEDATGRAIDPQASDFFRLRWDLADLASFTDRLRSPHSETADTRWALAGLNVVLGRER
jgi:spectinomycin phosphotransferase